MNVCGLEHKKQDFPVDAKAHLLSLHSFVKTAPHPHPEIFFNEA